jgi:N utilization substance protein B
VSRKDGMAAGRHRGRALTLQALYEADQSGHDPAISIERLIEDERAGTEPAAFARRLVAGVKQSRAQIDGYIRGSAPQWPLDQLAVVDRNILRIAIYEMLIENETPVRVAVNEAVELAKAFGSDASSRFVNGVLGALSAHTQQRGQT